jgi:hypothetical protein
VTGRSCVAERVARLRILLAQEDEGVVIDETSRESALSFLDELAAGGTHGRPATFVRQDGVVRLVWSVPTGERPWYQYGVSFVTESSCQVVWSDEDVGSGLDGGMVDRQGLIDHMASVGLVGFVRRGDRGYDLDRV